MFDIPRHQEAASGGAASAGQPSRHNQAGAGEHLSADRCVTNLLYMLAMYRHIIECSFMNINIG